jgi:putative FmdB family regulatory protein
MPLYEYECEACGGRFERIHRFSDPPQEICAICGQGPVRKLISAPAVHFKGTGWYVTDYANKKSDGSPKTDSGAPKAGSSAKAEAATSSSTASETSSGAAAETKAPAATESKPAEKK